MLSVKALAWGLLGLLLVGSVAAESEPVPVVFGYATDASPISYGKMDRNGATADGFCGSLLAFLKSSGHDIPVENQYQISNAAQRFENFHKYLGSNRIGIQCGSDSLTQERITTQAGLKGEFSVPFFVARARLLIRRNKIQILYTNPNSLKIGIQKGSDKSPISTMVAVNAFFPTAQPPTEFVERTDAIANLLSDDESSIDAYIGDDIVLLDIFNTEIAQAKKQDSYSIESPMQGYSREEFAVVIYNAPREKDGSSALKKKIDKWIQAESGGRQAIIDALGKKGIPRHMLALKDNMSIAEALPYKAAEYGVNSHTVSALLGLLAEADETRFKESLALMEKSLTASEVDDGFWKSLLLAESLSWQRLLFWGLVLCSMVLMVGILMWFYFMRQRVVALPQTLLPEQPAPDVTYPDPDPDMMAKLKKVKRELHDKIKQDLVGTRMFAELALKNVHTSSAKSEEYLQKVMATINTSIADMRDISHVIDACIENKEENAHPYDLLEFLDNVEVRFEAKGIKIIRDIELDFFALPTTVAEMFFLIVRETIENVENHAHGVSRVLIRLQQKDGMFDLTIQDDGQGFDDETFKRSEGIGIKNMRERVASQGGTFEINGKMGVTIRVRIPEK
ncbi:extracellular solute-binding protein, family 3 [Thiothrix caldifontis]|uniref:Extracellular solute-binding protein, family 3 n=1 Tax=Thiothrix caldifontis TaxID=525918 RepID=A0A1H4G6K5_9GAMM|nr:histidine kinase [Thiothrix caldifontis]SEB04931.1 extracellular solute-binding protein, family 3 [Thiothrix caldifontis]